MRFANMQCTCALGELAASSPFSHAAHNQGHQSKVLTTKNTARAGRESRACQMGGIEADTVCISPCLSSGCYNDSVMWGPHGKGGGTHANTAALQKVAAVARARAVAGLGLGERARVEQGCTASQQSSWDG